MGLTLNPRTRLTKGLGLCRTHRVGGLTRLTYLYYIQFFKVIFGRLRYIMYDLTIFIYTEIKELITLLIITIHQF
ncbi:hypothetical protein HanRHA438_Chr15g0721431 [Helianthus annuus]|nr:hypothetical protein HanRHA438_Chr15g0721431 [Helianthus annuus]